MLIHNIRHPKLILKSVGLPRAHLGFIYTHTQVMIRVTVHKISAEMMIKVEAMGMTSIYTDEDLLKGRTSEIHIQISRHVRKDGNR